MAFTNYGGLKAEIAQWLQRNDLTLPISSFVDLATARLTRQLRVPQMEQQATTTITGEWTALPSDFVAMRYVELENGTRLRHYPPDRFAIEVETKNQPYIPIYMIGDMSLRVFPLQTSTVVDLLYYRTVPPLVSDLDSNWVLTQFPNAYLACAMAEGCQFINDYAGMERWEAKAEKALAEIQQYGWTLQAGASQMGVRAG